MMAIEKSSAAFRPLVVALAALLHTLALGQGAAPALAAGDARVSPVALSAITPGFEVSAQQLDRWVTQTELSHSQLEQLGLRIGPLDEEAIRKLLESNEDFQSRRFVDYFDFQFAKPAERVQAEVWRTVLGVPEFIDDAVQVGPFDAKWDQSLRAAIADAAKEGDRSAQLKARGEAYRLLNEARQAAVRRARGYRQMQDMLRRELGSRELVKSIGMVIEVRVAARQPTIAPLSFVTMECRSANPRATAPTLAFAQRRRECSESGVCRVESIAEISKGPEYEAVFRLLQDNGRAYLDGCTLNTKLLIDGVETTRQLPGRYTMHTAPVPR